MPVSNDKNDPLELVPRAYQEEIFERAREENVIAALETGSGKTLIAVLLIKWIMAQSSQSLRSKKTVFLVPRVPLVDQQRSFVERQTPLMVRGYTGSMGVEAWDKGRWIREFEEADCLVMTAQIFKDVLVHGYWSMDRVSLLIFDECHNAQGHHPYRMIMVDHYYTCKDKPKIFGMTASPIWNPIKPAESIQALQVSLSSKVIAVREHVGSLGQHMYRPTEVVVRFSSSIEGRYNSYYNPTLWEHLQAVELTNIGQLSIRTLRIRYEVTLSAVGPAGADYFLLSHAKKVVEEYTLPQAILATSPTSSPSKRKSKSRAKNASRPSSPEKKKNGNDLSFGLDKLRAVVTSFEPRLVLDKRPLPFDWISPKLQAAVDILVKHRSETFQGIIFVSQRQLVAVLSWALSRAGETRDWVRCGELTGHGESSTGEGIKGMGISAQRDVVQSFKTGKLNLLIATSVGEEGLDFPACELVIRYDSVQHMVGYVQSRGRARQQKSTYVVMVDENDAAELARYEGFRQAEPGLKAVYQSLNAPKTPDSDGDEKLEADDADPLDLASRETYTIPSTGATLTYSSAIQLLNHLCSLIPRDAYTSPLRPKYTGDFQATVRLPQALPLPTDKHTFIGPLKHTKKEAKRAVAFMAVRELHHLGVFDDHLSPITSQKGESIEDADGKPIAKISEVPVMMDVFVANPWRAGPPWYLHLVEIGREGQGRVKAGLVCGTSLPEVELVVRGIRVQVRSRVSASPFNLDESQVDLLNRFTKMGIWWCITGSPIRSSPGCFLVPLTSEKTIDWSAMEKAMANEKGSNDWSGITDEKDGEKLVLMNSRKYGRPLRFRRFRPDLSLEDRPRLEEEKTDTDIQEIFDTYFDYFERKYPMKGKSAEKLAALFAPPVGRIIEVTQMARYPASSYDFSASAAQISNDDELQQPKRTLLLPESFCRHAPLSTDIIDALQVFAPVCQRLCDVYRARVARRLLKYPPIPDNLMIEALTLPCVNDKFNNQRLETIGDSVLKLSVVAHVYNHFPTKHEGQLTALKSNSVSNRLLLARARQVGLEMFLSCEPRNLRTWPFVLPSGRDAGVCEIGGKEVPLVRRLFARRSLQDCMEASLGAAYVTGGINLALQTGTALGLCFGGSTPWDERYPPVESVPPATLFSKLQEDLQYTFRNGNLLLEAVKHPSFDANEGGSCYQRLEFLGDAVVELVVTTYLYNKFPEATSGQLSWARARAICNATLAALAVKRLSLHKYLLANNVELNADVESEAQFLQSESTTYEDVAINDWKYDPPKALADIFESVVGAVFVDCGFRYEVVREVVERLMCEVLELLRPDIPRDPVTRLLEWVAKAGCTKAKFQRVPSDPSVKRKDSVAVLIHDRVVAGPIIASNKPLAKGLVAEEAIKVLSDDSSEFALKKICGCMRVDSGGVAEASDLPERGVREKDLDVETTEGFAAAGRVRLAEVQQEEEQRVREMLQEIELTEEEEEEESELREVEMLLCTPSTVTTEIDCMDCF